MLLSRRISGSAAARAPEALSCCYKSAAETCTSQEEDPLIDSYACRLRACGISGLLSSGLQLHHCIIHHGHHHHPFLSSLLVQMYGRCSDLKNAHACFSCNRSKTVFTWNFLIGASCKHGQDADGKVLFAQMIVEGTLPDSVTFVNVLSTCTFVDGVHLHTCIMHIGIISHKIVATAIFDMYGRCNRVKEARRIFERMVERDVVSWDAIIMIHAQQGHEKGALQIFAQMQEEAVAPDKITFLNMLSACANSVELTQGKHIHARLHCDGLMLDIVLASALLNMYGKCGSLRDANSLFYAMHERNVVSWSAMIAANAQHRNGKAAMELFHQMQHEGIVGNKITSVSVLDACAAERYSDDGMCIHSMVVKFSYENDVVVGTALVNMYCKCNRLDDAQRVFDFLPDRNVIAWNAMISGLVQHGFGQEALLYHDQMQRERVSLDLLTALAVLSGCACEASLSRGMSIHNHAIQKGFDLDVVIANAILNMYGKCGNLNEAWVVFDKVTTRDVVTWNSFIGLQAQHGVAEKVLESFCKMQHQGVMPNEVTFLSVLSACSHAGFIDKVLCLLIYMTEGHLILPTAGHFDCLIDLLGKAGSLDAAELLISQMPFQPSVISWTALLGASKSQADVKRGEFAAKLMLELDRDNETPYVALLNLYSSFSETVR